MKSSYSTLMQSKFFNPAFNSAIFDGPIRIYFAQFHEALALKIYFLIQQKLVHEVTKAKDLSRASGANILIMIYPSEESYLMSFESESGSSDPICLERWNEDVVLGCRGPIEDQHLDTLIQTLGMAIESWNPAVKAIPSELQFEA